MKYGLPIPHYVPLEAIQVECAKHSLQFWIINAHKHGLTLLFGSEAGREKAGELLKPLVEQFAPKAVEDHNE